MSECYYALCQHHSCHQGDDEGPYCGIEKCVVSETGMIPLEIARRFDLYRMGVNIHVDGEHIPGGIKTLDERIFARYNEASREVKLSWVDQWDSQCVYHTDIKPEINIVDYAVRAMWSLGVVVKQ